MEFNVGTGVCKPLAMIAHIVFYDDLKLEARDTVPLAQDKEMPNEHYSICQ
jgi:hypothetical protein